MQEVYAGEPVNHGSARQVRLVQLEHQPGEAEHKTSPQRCQRSLAIETGEEDTEQEAGGNRRGDVGLHALQIDVELGRDVLHERDPDQPKEHQDHRRHASDEDQPRFRCIGAPLPIDVPGKQRRTRVEGRRQRAH